MVPRTIWTAIAVGLLVATAGPAAAQLSPNLGALTAQNAKGYLGPLPEALSGTLNTAIFQTGSVPKTGVSFTIGVRAMAVKFDDEQRLYTPQDPPGFTSTNPSRVPTVIGDPHAVAQSGQGGATLYYPGGFDIKNFALAVPQATIGTVFGTRAVVRWISVDVGTTDLGKFDLFGIGAQHSISQYVPMLPVDLAAGFFYQSFKINDDLVKTKSYQFNVTGSKSFGLFQPYVGLGYDSFDMDIKYTSDTAQPNQTIKVSFDTKNNAHLTAGVQATLAVVKLNAEFNQAATTGVAVGLSFGR